ncbi:unnamed protein product [Linum trigynum]|uniref:Uncharacterized protein n=1 Tax=Linum trigynum TaxID=586398 RepID=A0AAV2CGY7_9ROSI
MEICRPPAQFFTGTSHISRLIRTFPAAIASLSPSPTVNSIKIRMFMLGMGYVGQFFGQQLKNEGWRLARARGKKRSSRRRGLMLLSLMPMSMSDCTHLLVSIPPIPGVGDPLLKHEELLRCALVDGSLQWLCYLSLTRVYGDCSGAWVDEDYPASPSIEPSKSRLLAENEWLRFGHSLGLSTQVLRLGGIYGPCRSAIDTLIKRQPLTSHQKMRSSK